MFILRFVFSVKCLLIEACIDLRVSSSYSSPFLFLTEKTRIWQDTGHVCHIRYLQIDAVHFVFSNTIM